jgi:hypothetical protein
MDRFDDDTLLAELREIRPTPRPEFTAELDERAAAGFPRRSSASASPFAALADRWRALTPRRRLIPSLGAAFAVLAVATIVIAVAGSGGSSSSRLSMTTSAPATEATETGGAENQSTFEAEGPALEAAPSAGAGAEKAPAVGGGHRDIERSTYITLGTKPGEVSSAAAKIFEAVHAVDGVVLHSKVQSGSAGATGAYFDLLIPSRKLDDALSSFSQIAEVRERHDATNDITAPTVGAAEELRDSNAAIEGLLKELGDAETGAERESVEARLREERGRHAAIRARLDNLDRRASMSEVTVRIVTDHGAGVTPAGKGGSWGIGDALHDAGHILTIAAGVALIGLAILGPIALIVLALWLANRFRLRRLRERTLG